MRKLTGNLAAIVFGLLLTLLLLEAMLRLLPVNEGLRTQPVHVDAPIYHFEPNRTSTWSNLADFSMHNRVHANNFGFINDQDYTTDGTSPLTAVIGDSFVEAVMVPYPETIQGRLADLLQGQCRIYSFAASGAPLSQYLAYAEYACTTFHAKKLIFVIVGNDFDESLARYANMPGFHYFSEHGNTLELTRKDYAPSWAVRLVRHSRLALYLLTNVRIQDIWNRWRQDSAPAPNDYVGQTRAAVDPERLRLSLLAVDAFLHKLPEATGLAPNQVLFLVDGIRPQLYDSTYQPETDHSYFAQMRRDFMLEAKNNGFNVVDLQPYFRSAFSATRTRYEFPLDAHWNGPGHEIAARAVMESGFLDDCR